jgi:hypothetical protein
VAFSSVNFISTFTFNLGTSYMFYTCHCKNGFRVTRVIFENNFFSICCLNFVGTRCTGIPVTEEQRRCAKNASVIYF